MPLTFGTDEAPVDRTPMAFAATAPCGHVRSWVYDDGSAAAARWAGDVAGPGVVLARVPVAEAKAATGRCGRCGTPVRAHNETDLESWRRWRDAYLPGGE